MISALSAAGTIADGYGRYTAPEQRQLYRAAKRELLRLETQLAIARQADLISAHTHADLSDRIQSVNGCSAAISCTSNDSSKRLIGEGVGDGVVGQPLLLPCPFTNRSTRSTVRNRASDAGCVPTTRMAVLDRCDDDAKPRILATSRRS